MRIRFHRMAIRGWFVLFVVVACLSSGCTQLDVSKSPSIPFLSDGKDDPQAPSRVVAVWVDTIRYTQGKPATRGFGGRLMFYGAEEDPVKVDGDLIVYAFDEDGRRPADPRPTRKFVFRDDSLDIHYSKSKAGHSYSFFLPWDDVGGLRKEISLIVRFQPKLGAVVASEQTHHILPGKPRPEETQLAEPGIGAGNEGGVHAASYYPGANVEVPQKTTRGRMQTSTIELPSRLGQQRPKAVVRPRVTRSRARGAGPAAQEPPGDREQPAESATRLPLSGYRAQAAPTARQERGRALSTPRLAEWQSPGRSPLPAASDSESN